MRKQRERDALPPLGNTEMTLEIASRWNALTDEEKEPWNALYKQHMEQYTEDKKNYLRAKNARLEREAMNGASVEAPSEVKDVKPRKKPARSESKLSAPEVVDSDEEEEEEEVEEDSDVEEVADDQSVVHHVYGSDVEQEELSEPQVSSDEEDEVMANEPVEPIIPATQVSRKPHKNVYSSPVQPSMETPVKSSKRKHHLAEQAPTSEPKKSKKSSQKKHRKSSALF